MKSTLFVEFPDFGFGPASSVASILRSISKSKQVTLLSSGGALNFVSREIPYVKKVRVNTMDPNNFAKISTMVPKGAWILSHTNPEFASWAVDKNYRVVVWDLLDWMWDDKVSSVENAHSYISQYYYGRYRRTRVPDDRITVQPTFAPFVRRGKKLLVETNDVLVAFGGMGNPYSETLESSYVRAILPVLIDTLSSFCEGAHIYIVGGLLDEKPISNKAATIVHGDLRSEDYLQLLLTCRYKFLTPGVMSIYECIEYGQIPFFLPGSNVSQVLQAHDLFKRTDYKHMFSWHDQNNVVTALESLSEHAGIDYLESEVVGRFTEKCELGSSFIELIKQYVTTLSESDADEFQKIRREWQKYPLATSIIDSLNFD